MKVYEVGKKYEEYKFYRDVFQFDMTDSGGILKVGLGGATKKEIKAIKEGRLRCSLAVVKGIIFLVWNFRGMNSLDTPFNINHSRVTNLQEVTEGTGYSTTIELFDTYTGELLVYRLISFNTAFSQAFKKAVEEQACEPWNEQEYGRSLDEVYSKYSTSKLEKMAIISCKV